MAGAHGSRQTVSVLDDHGYQAVAAAEEASRLANEPDPVNESTAAVECIVPVATADIEFVAGGIADDYLRDEPALRYRALAMHSLPWRCLSWHLHRVLPHRHPSSIRNPVPRARQPAGLFCGQRAPSRSTLGRPGGPRRRSSRCRARHMVAADHAPHSPAATAATSFSPNCIANPCPTVSPAPEPLRIDALREHNDSIVEQVRQHRAACAGGTMRCIRREHPAVTDASEATGHAPAGPVVVDGVVVGNWHVLDLAALDDRSPKILGLAAHHANQELGGAPLPNALHAET